MIITRGFILNYNQLKQEAEVLLGQNKSKYFQLCIQQLGLKISDHRLSTLLKLEYLPIYVALKEIFQKKQNTTFLGIAGVNGSGKTTLTQFLSTLLQSESYNVVQFSMDDLYPTKEVRLKRAETIHPSLKTRLMYDNVQVQRIFQGLKRWEGPLDIPQFDKAVDDRAPKEKWRRVLEKPDFVIAEGVFTFAKPITDTNLSTADKFLNSQVRELEVSYEFIDFKLTLLTESIKNVIQYRQQQEIELQKTRGKTVGMSPQEVEAFIRYFYPYIERYTAPQVNDPRIDLVFTLDLNRKIIRISSPKQGITYLEE